MYRIAGNFRERERTSRLFEADFSYQYLLTVLKRHCQYCIPTYSEVQSSACQYSTTVEINQAGNDATPLEWSVSTIN